MTRVFYLFAVLLAAAAARAQVSLTAAVDAALRTSPRIKMAEAEVIKARAQLAESKDVFVPSVTAGAGLGQSYGYSPNPPTLFTLSANSLAYNASQIPYIHSARAGYDAARKSFEDVRESVAEDAALTFVALEHDQQREAVLQQQYEFSSKLAAIIQDRFDAGLDTHMDLTTAKLSAAQLRVARLRAQDDTDNDRVHLASLMSRPTTGLRADDSYPTAPTPNIMVPVEGYANASVAAAFLSAHAKEQAAIGDSKYLYRPQFAVVAQYSRYATFTNSFGQLKVVDPITMKDVPIGANESLFGLQITLPLFDRGRLQKNRESMAEASRSLHEAEQAQRSALEGQAKLRHTLEELDAQAEAAALAQQLAQEQLEIIQLQLTAPVSGAAALTPKDEQNARISEREKYLSVVDTTFQLRQARISLLRQSGQLVDWLTQAGMAPPPAPPIPTLKHP